MDVCRSREGAVGKIPHVLGISASYSRPTALVVPAVRRYWVVAGSDSVRFSLLCVFAFDLRF